jgi:uncharacterized protein (TIGR01777 family)
MTLCSGYLFIKVGGGIMRFMIAGGSGLIGRELTSSLTSIGDEVIILSRSPEKVTGLPVGSRAIQWDGKTVQDWGREMETCDVVINLTGENLSGDGFLPTRWSKGRKLSLVQSRVNSGHALTKAIEMAAKKPFVFVQASGINYYDIYSEKVITEADEAGNDFLANLSKEWEASSLAVESMGIRRVITRNGVVLSMKGGALRFLLLPYKLFVGGRLGSGKQIYSWIHIRDEIEAIIHLVRNDHASGPYNLTSPNSVTNDDFGRTIAKVMKRPHYLPVPALAMRLAFGEVAAMVLEGQKVVPQRLLESGFTFKYPILEDALKELLK